MSKQMTHAEQDKRDQAYIADLLAGPRYCDVKKDGMEAVCLALRKIHVKHFPHERNL